jgi:hypothetical protein
MCETVDEKTIMNKIDVPLTADGYVMPPEKEAEIRSAASKVDNNVSTFISKPLHVYR